MHQFKTQNLRQKINIPKDTNAFGKIQVWETIVIRPSTINTKSRCKHTSHLEWL